MKELIKKLADEYAHCYSFVGDDTMPIKRAELHAAIDEALSPGEFDEVTLGMRHIAHTDTEKIYLLASVDGSWLAKFQYENRVEYQKAREFVDAVLAKISKVNMEAARA